MWAWILISLAMAQDPEPAWTLQFEGPVLEAQATAGGLLHLVVRDGKKDTPPTRLLLDPPAETTVWEGPAIGSALLVEDPAVVLVERDGQAVVLRPGGWETSLGTATPVARAAAAGVVHVAMADDWTGDEAPRPLEIVAVDLDTGAIGWRAPVGDVPVPLASTGMVLALPDGAWWAGGGRAVRLSAAGDAVVKADLPGVPERALAHGGGLAIATTSAVTGVTGTGATWTIPLPEGGEVDGIALVGGVLAVSAVGMRERQVLGVDPVRGDERFHLTLTQRRRGVPAGGIASTGDHLLFAVDRDLIAVDAAGAEVWRAELDGDLVEALAGWRIAGDHVVAIAQNQPLRAWSIATGAPSWTVEDFKDPALVHLAVDAMGGALMSVAMQSALGVHYRSGAASDAAARGHYDLALYYEALLELAEARAGLEAQRPDLFTAIRSRTNIPVTTVNRPHARYLSQPVVTGRGLASYRQADAVAVDLHTGEVVFRATMPKGTDACVTRVAIDPVEGWFAFAREQLALGCTIEDRLEVYHAPGATP